MQVGHLSAAFIVIMWMKATFMPIWCVQLAGSSPTQAVCAVHLRASTAAHRCLRHGVRRICRAVAMATTLPFMLLTGSVHPPGGALVLTLVDSAKMQGLGWWYLICPGMLGLLVLLPLAALANWVKVRSRTSRRRSAEAPSVSRGVSRSAGTSPLLFPHCLAGVVNRKPTPSRGVPVASNGWARWRESAVATATARQWQRNQTRPARFLLLFWRTTHAYSLNDSILIILDLMPLTRS